MEAAADAVLAHVAQERAQPGRVVCASGISPSGPIHLGNLREVMTAHLVAEELRRRGHDVVHVHSWDDFDRLRRIPAEYVGLLGEEQIGRPLADVPDPLGELASYAERHVREFEGSLARLGVRPRAIRQAAAYRAGRYAEATELALRERHRIFDVLARFQTEKLQAASREERRAAYYPVRIYCSACGRDATRVEAYDEATTALRWSCEACGAGGESPLRELDAKLVWKVDWPMRWAHERVDFEPGGADHSSPGSSYDVGRHLAPLFGWRAPAYVAYAFVGAAGRSKLSGSAGGAALPRQALDILEPPLLRWLYARRRPEQAFSVDFGKEVLRLYDEWDGLARRVRGGGATPVQERVLATSTATAEGPVARAELPLSFRMLSSVADLTEGNREQLLRIARAHLDGAAPDDLEPALEPRLTCAVNWALAYQPEDERTAIRREPAPEEAAALGPTERDAVARLLARLDGAWSLEGLTALVYAIPKEQAGLDPGAEPTDEVRAAQRAFFVALYRLLVGSDTGPRLPTLLLSIGRERARALLGPAVS